MRAKQRRANRAQQRCLSVAVLLLCGSSFRIAAESGPEQPTQAVAASARPDLSGVWLLNQKLSEDPQQKLQEARQQDRLDHSRRSDWGNRRGVAGGAGMGRGGGSGHSMEGVSRLRSLWSAPPKLSLSHQEPRLEMEIDDQRTRTLYTDNRGVSVSASGGRQQWVSTAGWEKGALVVETTTDAGAQLIERYRLSAGGQRLEVIRELWTLRESEPIRMETVYDRNKPPD